MKTSANLLMCVNLTKVKQVFFIQFIKKNFFKKEVQFKNVIFPQPHVLKLMSTYYNLIVR